MMASVRIAPSILSADFTRLGEQIAAAEAAGADQIHLDIMDGHFVPNLSMGPVVVEAARRASRLPLDVHLMVEQPERFVEPFAKAGANALTVHIEASGDISRTVAAIHSLRLRAGIAIKPLTPLDALDALLPALDIVLMMTVEPGFGGQQFLARSPERIAGLRRRLEETHSNADLSVDGGIDQLTALEAVKAGATVLVAGNAIFHNPDGIEAAVRGLRNAITV